jgi:hypothetical protein
VPRRVRWGSAADAKEEIVKSIAAFIADEGDPGE